MKKIDLSNIAVYNRYAESYNLSVAQLKNYEESYNQIIQLLPEQAQILDLACGPGNISGYLKDKNPGYSITGVDYSQSMIDLAQKRIPDGKFICSAIQLYEFPFNRFDCVILGFGLPFIPWNHVSHIISSIRGALRISGIFYLSFMEGKHSGAEKTSFTGQDELYFYYHQRSEIKKNLKNNSFKIIHESLLDYHETDGATTEDNILISQKSE
jgi:SAM-dependent methyltransferase